MYLIDEGLTFMFAINGSIYYFIVTAHSREVCFLTMFGDNRDVSFREHFQDSPSDLNDLMDDSSKFNGTFTIKSKITVLVENNMDGLP